VHVATVFYADGTTDFFAMAFAINPGGDVSRLANIFMLQQIWVFIMLTMEPEMAFTAGFSVCSANCKGSYAQGYYGYDDGDGCAR
jgi:hypothetical protein